MPLVYLTKGIEFAAAHRYVREEWDEAKNRETFGACFNAPGHGHNYFLEVTVAGDVESETGMVVNLYDLKVVLKQVLEEFDHKHLNLDTPYFKDTVPTMENIARVLWRALERHRMIGQLETVKLAEDEDLCGTIRRGTGLDRASIARRYSVPFEPPGSSWVGVRNGRSLEADLWITVGGRIDPVTGMVIDLKQLDRLVQERVVAAWSGFSLALRRPDRVATGEELVRGVWDQLSPHLAGVQLERVKLVESRDLCYEHVG